MKIDKSWRKDFVIENYTGGYVKCSADKIEEIMEEMLEEQKKKINGHFARLLGDLNLKEFRDEYCSPSEEV